MGSFFVPFPGNGQFWWDANRWFGESPPYPQTAPTPVFPAFLPWILDIMKEEEPKTGPKIPVDIIRPDPDDEPGMPTTPGIPAGGKPPAPPPYLLSSPPTYNFMNSPLAKFAMGMFANPQVFPADLSAVQGIFTGVPIGTSPTDVPFADLIQNRGMNLLKNILSSGGGINVPQLTLSAADVNNLARLPSQFGGVNALSDLSGPEFMQAALRSLQETGFAGQGQLQSAIIPQIFGAPGSPGWFLQGMWDAGNTLDSLNRAIGQYRNPMFNVQNQLLKQTGQLSAQGPEKVSPPTGAAAQIDPLAATAGNQLVNIGNQAFQQFGPVSPVGQSNLFGDIQNIAKSIASPWQANIPSIQGRAEEALTNMLQQGGLSKEFIDAMQRQVYEPGREQLLTDLNRFGGGTDSLASGLNAELQRRFQRDFQDSLTRIGFENYQNALAQAQNLGAQQFGQNLANINLSQQGLQTGAGILSNLMGQDLSRQFANQAAALQSQDLGSRLLGQGLGMNLSQALQQAQLGQGMTQFNLGNIFQGQLANQAAQNQFNQFLPQLRQQQLLSAAGLSPQMFGMDLQKAGAQADWALGLGGFGLQSALGTANTGLDLLTTVANLQRQPIIDQATLQNLAFQNQLAALNPYMQQNQQMLDFFQNNVKNALQFLQNQTQGEQFLTTLLTQIAEAEKDRANALAIAKEGVPSGWPGAIGTMGAGFISILPWLLSSGKFKSVGAEVSPEETRKYIDSIRLRRFRYNHAPEKEHIGFILEEADPQLGDVSGNMIDVDIIGILVGAIKDLKNQIEELKNDIRR